MARAECLPPIFAFALALAAAHFFGSRFVAVLIVPSVKRKKRESPKRMENPSDFELTVVNYPMQSSMRLHKQGEGRYDPSRT